MQEPVDRDAHPTPSGAVGVKEREEIKPTDSVTAEVVDGAPEPHADSQEPAKDEGRLERLFEAVEKTELAPGKAATLRAILKGVRDSIDNALKLLEAIEGDGTVSIAPTSVPSALRPVSAPPAPEAGGEGERVVEGVFDGQNMVGDDGKSYSVPPNYASKSKLVEGDMLKLTITAKGNFIYKQIGPIERQRLVGTVSYEQDSGLHVVLAGGRNWRVLKASITYFHADVSDEAVILVPKNAPSKWAAVENIIKRSPQQTMSVGA